MTAHRSVVVRVLLTRARSAPAQSPIPPPEDAITGAPGCGRAVRCNELQRAALITRDRGPGGSAETMPSFAPSDIQYPE